MASYRDWVDNFLLPSGSFKGPDSKRDLRNARCIMLLFYIGYTGAFVYLVVALIFSGRVEVYQQAYKMDMIEAPSVAICPFYPGAKIIRPEGGAPASSLIQAFKYGRKGEEKLDVEAYSCTYDRECMCVNLYDTPKTPTVFRDYAQRDVNKIGTTGVASENEMTFRERIEVRTNITDSSADKTLKVGFYDSVDQSPQWFYMSEGVWVLGSLELNTWTVSDFTFGALKETFDGELDSMVKQRHIFRYTSQEVGARGAATESFISYEMKNFFVDDTMSSETAFSPYTLIYLLVLLMVRSAVISVFTNTVFPEYNPNKNQLTIREHSGAAQSLVGYCGCCCCWPASAETEEKEPLLATP